MTWTVRVTGKAGKLAKKLPSRISAAFEILLKEMALSGPVRHEWPNYGKLKGKPGYHHCHLNKGKPRYVAVWREVKGEIELLEVRYVGTHEKADYKRID